MITLILSLDNIYLFSMINDEMSMIFFFPFLPPLCFLILVHYVMFPSIYFFLYPISFFIYYWFFQISLFLTSNC